MAYDSGTGVLIAPFTKIGANGQGDLQKALGRTTCYSEIQLVKDVDANNNDVGAVNVFAKYKPFPYNGMWANDASGKAARLAANKSTNYAMTIPTFTNWSTLISGTPSNYATKWTYNKPGGTATQPLRALDFDGYISHCREWGLGSSDDTHLYSPFGVAIYLPSKEIGTDDVVQMEFTKGNNALNDYLLYLDDFNTTSLPLNNYYFGILAVGATSSNSRMYVSSYRPVDVSNDYLWFEIPVTSSLPTDTYTFVPVLCSAKLSSPNWAGSIPSGGTVVTLDGYKFSGIQKQAYSSNLGVFASLISQTSTTTTFEVKIRNRTGSAITLTDIFMFVEPSYYIDWDPEVDQYIAEQTDWRATSKTDAQFKANIVYNNKVVAHYVDIYSVLAARGGTYPTRIGSGSQYDVTLNVTINAVADGNGHPYNTESFLIGWFRYNSTKYNF